MLPTQLDRKTNKKKTKMEKKSNMKKKIVKGFELILDRIDSNKIICYIVHKSMGEKKKPNKQKKSLKRLFYLLDLIQIEQYLCCYN